MLVLALVLAVEAASGLVAAVVVAVVEAAVAVASGIAAAKAMAVEAANIDCRQRELEAVADIASRRWVERWRLQLRGQGRPVAGGWPGTLPEARANARVYFEQQQVQKRNAPLTCEETEWLARATYAKARQEWLRGAALRR